MPHNQLTEFTCCTMHLRLQVADFQSFLTAERSQRNGQRFISLTTLLSPGALLDVI